MGYTHYWYGLRPFTGTEWASIKEDAYRLLIGSPSAGSVVPIAKEFDEPASIPTINNDLIAFNGVGDDGHETFWMQRGPDEFQFCKTAAKPYDVLVTAMLIVCHKHAPDALRISSDGDASDWEAGLALTYTRCGAGYSNPIR